MKGYRTKKIALPGGRTIEIVYFYDEDDAATGTDPAGPAEAEAAAASHETAATAVEEVVEEAVQQIAEEGSGLHLCPSCDGDLVYPVAWEERGAEGWHIERRCPNCEWRHEGDFDQEDVEEFDDILNEGTEALLTGLRNFSRANMASDVERLIEAINEDRILPMDF